MNLSEKCHRIAKFKRTELGRKLVGNRKRTHIDDKRVVRKN